MKRILSFLFTLSCLMAWANDGIYYTSGSFLIPVQETDISVSKEVLTITIGKGGYAEVDVQYEFNNPKAAKTVLMAFEADAPYNAQSTFNRKGIHPFIKDFTVTMNGKALTHRNAVVAKTYDQQTEMTRTDFVHPLDLSGWLSYKEAPDKLYIDNALYNPKLDSIMSYAYAYYFDAPFQAGRNTVHHTYKYMMSDQVGEDFCVPYWLTPATRWANHQIDDFTLRVIDERGDGICLNDTLFMPAPFNAIKGECWQLDEVADWEDKLVPRSVVFANSYSTVEWHGRNFRPTSNIEIFSANSGRIGTSQTLLRNSKLVAVDAQGEELGRYIGTCGNQYLIEVQDYGLVPKASSKLVLYNAEHSQGWLVIAPEYTGVNIRERPNAKSPIVTTIHSEKGELPEAYRCLGKIEDDDPTAWKQWYYIQVGDKKGYVNANLMLWDAINTY